MNQLSKHMQHALEAVRSMPSDQQDLLAAELLDFATALSAAPTRLTAEERAELEADQAAARRGELATDAAVEALYARYGV